MAGAGAKLFTSGSVLTADQVNTFLMDQSIMRFTSTTTRDAAFGGAGEPTLAEGMFAYTTDTNTLWFYTGSAWQNVLGSNIGEISTSNRNKIINGGFDIWQRGTSFTTAYAYTADRWFIYRDGSGGTVTASQQTFTAGTAPVAGYEGTYFFRFNQTVAGTGGTENLFQQNIESVRTFANQTVTVSFWAKADTNRTLQSQIQQYFGVGGSARVDQTAISHSLTTSWQRFTATFTVPSIAGKTIGANDSLGVVFRLANNTTQTIDIWGVQVEAGSVATPFETEDIGVTLRKCQRYYEKSYNQGVNPATDTTDGMSGIFLALTSGTAANIGTTAFYKVTKRANPTVTAYSKVGTAGNFSNTLGGGDVPSTVLVLSGQTGFVFYNTTTVTSTISIHWVASAEL